MMKKSERIFLVSVKEENREILNLGSFSKFTDAENNINDLIEKYGGIIDWDKNDNQSWVYYPRNPKIDYLCIERISFNKPLTKT